MQYKTGRGTLGLMPWRNFNNQLIPQLAAGLEVVDIPPGKRLAWVESMLKLAR